MLGLLLLSQHSILLKGLHVKLPIDRVAQVTEPNAVSLSIVSARLHYTIGWRNLRLNSYELGSTAVLEVLGRVHYWDSLLSVLVAGVIHPIVRSHLGCLIKLLLLMIRLC